MDHAVLVSLEALALTLEETGCLHALWVGGSVASGDYIVGVSDVDAVAVVSDRLSEREADTVRRTWEYIERSAAPLRIGCQFVPLDHLHDLRHKHRTWTHGREGRRTLSGLARIELRLVGITLFGPSPADLLPRVAPGQVTAATRAELTGYWAYAARRPPMFAYRREMVDLGLTAMARARYSLVTDRLLTKSAAVPLVRAPAWLRADIARRREGLDVTSPRMRSAYFAWRDVAMTVSQARRGPAGGDTSTSS